MRPAYLLIVALCAACSSSSSSDTTPGTDSGSDTSGGGDPTIKITKPSNGATLATTDLTDGTDYDVAFTYTNFTLKDPGACAGAASCGHVHLLIDGSDCTPPGEPYNAAGSSSPITAGFDYCKSGIPGTHKITLELHNDDHSPVKVGGNTVSDSVTVTVTGGTDAGTDTPPG